jgi:ribulose-phosphate 3-epimerase
MSTDNKNILISPSIIASDLTIIGETVRSFNPALVDLIHCDVMDGNFVPNLTFGPGFMQELKKHTDIPLDAHLMIERPERSIDQYIKVKPWSLTIHYESTRFPARLLGEIRSAGIVAGISINPATPVEAVYDLLPYADLVLIMSVDPGFYGQAFMEPAVGRIRKLSQHIKQNGLSALRIEVDGGINTGNIAAVAAAGAGIIVVGNSAFKGGDISGNIRNLLKNAGA